MRRLLPRIAALSILTLPAAALASPAFAQAADVGREARIAVLQHDVLHPDTLETGVDIEAQVFSNRIEGLYGRPRAYVSAAANSDGDTNFASVGLAWSRRLGEHWTGELQVGYAVHDGVLDDDDPVRSKDRLLLGSRDLFRTAVGADYALNDRWAVGVQWTHLSHGQILGDGHNQGIDAVGLRFSRRFGR